MLRIFWLGKLFREFMVEIIEALIEKITFKEILWDLLVREGRVLAYMKWV